MSRNSAHVLTLALGSLIVPAQALAQLTPPAGSAGAGNSAISGVPFGPVVNQIRRMVETSLEAVALCGASLLSDAFAPVPSPSERGFLNSSPQAEPSVQISRTGLPR